MRSWVLLPPLLLQVLVQTACDVCDGPDVVDSAQIRSQDDADDLEGIACILGDLEIGVLDEETPDPIDLAPLADLMFIEGDLEVSVTLALARLDLPNVSFIGRRGLERDGERVRGGMFIQNNSALSSFDLGALTDVGGCIEIRDNPLLSNEDVDALFSDVKAHAFPGTCDAGATAKEQSGNGGGGR